MFSCMPDAGYPSSSPYCPLLLGLCFPCGGFWRPGEDLERNDGSSSKPFYMSPGLHKILRRGELGAKFHPGSWGVSLCGPVGWKEHSRLRLTGLMRHNVVLGTPRKGIGSNKNLDIFFLSHACFLLTICSVLVEPLLTFLPYPRGGHRSLQNNHVRVGHREQEICIWTRRPVTNESRSLISVCNRWITTDNRTVFNLWTSILHNGALVWT